MKSPLKKKNLTYKERLRIQKQIMKLNQRLQIKFKTYHDDL